MRFARHAKIFRGPLDIAPVAGVVLLLMMFMLLGSLVYTPGVLVNLSQTLTVTRTNTFVFAGNTYPAGDVDRLRTDLNSPPGNEGFSVAVEPGADPALGRQASNLLEITPITVTRTNAVVFAGNTYSAGELDRLRTDLKNSPSDSHFRVTMESGADPALARQASNLFQVTLPEGRNLAGTDNATVVVAVNFRGQCFYENRLVQDAELKKELGSRLKNAARNSKKLTMILLVDKAAEYQVLSRLCGLASEAGVAEVLMAERPAVFGAHP